MDNVTITGAEVSELPLFNTAFVSTSATPHENGTIRLTQNMHGVAAPMQGYSGNISGAAAGMEQVRTGVRDGSAAHRFFETLLGTSSADAAAAMIQSVSGETVINAAWASNDALKGFAALGRTQGRHFRRTGTEYYGSEARPVCRRQGFPHRHGTGGFRPRLRMGGRPGFLDGSTFAQRH